MPTQIPTEDEFLRGGMVSGPPRFLFVWGVGAQQRKPMRSKPGYCAIALSIPAQAPLDTDSAP